MKTTDTILRYSEDKYIHTPPGAHIASCPGCGLLLAFRLFLNVIGERVVIVGMAGCFNAMLGPLGRMGRSYQGKPIFQLHSQFGQGAIYGGGIKSGLVARGDTETQVLVWAGDGATFDLGLSGVSGASERNEDIIYVCYDNEIYMNTGRHRSGATPYQAVTMNSPLPSPKQEYKKDIMSIILAAGVPYAATATPAHPDDLMRKAQKAKDTKGFRFIHMLCPCPTGWSFPSDQSLEMGRLAVDTKIFPIYEVENGFEYTINKEPKGIPVEKYVKAQGRTRHMTPQQIENLQANVDKRWERLQKLAKRSKESEFLKH